jgi:hypothetical protein
LLFNIKKKKNKLVGIILLIVNLSNPESS